VATVSVMSNSSNGSSKGEHVEGVEKGDVYVWTGKGHPSFVRCILIVSEHVAVYYRFDGSVEMEKDGAGFGFLFGLDLHTRWKKL